jgi:hypothetical protein
MLRRVKDDLVLELSIGIAHLVLSLIAFFWVLGFIPIHARWGRMPEAPYRLKRDLAETLMFLLWMGSGYALYRWLLPAPWNPFFS